jgi:hypothetical protein
MKHTLLLSLSLAALPGTVLAQQPQDAPARTLTRDEYRACMDNQDALKARADAIRERTGKLSQEGEAIKAEDQQLQEEQKRVEDSSLPGMRDRFERKVKAHNARVRAADDQGKALQADAKKFSEDLDAHNAKCANVGVNREDREAVTKEREAAGKK